MELAITKLTNESGVPVTTLTKADITLRKYDDETTIYDYDSLGNLGGGNYVLYGINFSSRPVRIYISGVSQTAFGILQIGEIDSLYLSKAGTTIDVESKKIVNVSNGTASGDAVNYSQLSGLANSIASDYLPKAGGTMTGEIDMSGEKITNLPEAEDDTEAVPFAQMKDYVGEQISNVPTILHQAQNIVKVIEHYTQNISGKIYNTISGAYGVFGTLNVNSQGMILIEHLDSPTKTIIPNSKFKNYLHYRSMFSNYVFGTGETNINYIMNFENLVLWLSTTLNSTARVLTGVTLKDVEIYSNVNFTLNNCILKNVNIYLDTGKTLTLAGSTKLLNVFCNADEDSIIKDGSWQECNAGFFYNLGSNFIPNGSFPSDPFIPS